MVNAHYAKNVPGRKTDVSDASWLRQLHSYGLLRGRFRPSAEIATLRAHLRQRERLVEYPHGRPRIVDYNAKWEEGAFAFENSPRSFEFGDEDFLLLDLMKKLVLRCWRVFGLSGYARVDFRVDRRNRPLILEVNTNPCLAPDAGFAAAAACAGLSYSQLVLRIVDAARSNRKAA